MLAHLSYKLAYLSLKLAHFSFKLTYIPYIPYLAHRALSKLEFPIGNMYCIIPKERTLPAT